MIQNISSLGVAQAVFTNTYSANNNRLTVSEVDGTLVTFGYDTTSQLVLEQRSGSEAYNISYTYDPNGNRNTQSSSGAVTEYQYNAANEQILITPPTGAPTTQTFDAVGNLTLQNAGGALTTMVWSPENRMLSVSNPDGSSEQNTYSADGLRKSKTSSGATTNFTWDNQNLLLETNTSNVVQARYTDFPGYWGGLASQNRSGTSSFYLCDSQGSVRNLASILGAITDTYIYTAFGVELLSSGSTVNPFRYVGLYGYYRELVDIYYIRARWLDAFKGRWDSRDPIGWGGKDVNMYRYARNRSTTRKDPTGLRIDGGFQGSGCEDDFIDNLGKCCSGLVKRISNNKVKDSIYDCMTKKKFPKSETQVAIDGALSFIAQACAMQGSHVCVWCPSFKKGAYEAPPSWPAACELGCGKGHTLGSTLLPVTTPQIPTAGTHCEPYGRSDTCTGLISVKLQNGSMITCDAAIVVCYHRVDPTDVCSTLWHELVHVGGLRGRTGHHRGKRPDGKNDPGDDFIFALSCCLCNEMYPKNGPDDSSICLKDCASFE